MISAPPGWETLGLGRCPHLCRGLAGSGPLSRAAEAGLASVGPASRGAPGLRGLPRVAAGARGVLFGPIGEGHAVSAAGGGFRRSCREELCCCGALEAGRPVLPPGRGGGAAWA
ncbi:hypothetical protein NDU88_008695, partial [Pleurodeles waltl]